MAIHQQHIDELNVLLQSGKLSISAQSTQPHANGDWRERLLACVKAKWRHFEHLLM